MTVYPRACGGTELNHQIQYYSMGLSPRVRGNLDMYSLYPNASRSIPARAGEPPVRLNLPAGTPVYPRACGGTNPSPVVGGRCGGLSPRVRGNHWAYGSGGNGVRSIPARAGEPTGTSRRRRRGWVYPRACGGTKTPDKGKDMVMGLSPRVRGNQFYIYALMDSGGSIPARAGEPRGDSEPRLQGKVYPRACGGTWRERSPSPSNTGLSPRVRGNRRESLGSRRERRSIPARAGEPSWPSRRRGWATVYPRACGGTWFKDGDTNNVLGLSPRVRGNLRELGSTPTTGRSIPARAGEPTDAKFHSDSTRVYPRACGGTWFKDGDTNNVLGLSPRVRGNPLAFCAIYA